ncbi:MAG: ABC transporter permease [Thermotogae bacterium]|nr:ABC transporter permease [Thermotogota bacterium]
MKTVLKLIKYEAYNTLRSRFVVGYALFFVLLTSALSFFSGDMSKVIISLLNIVILFVPLISLVFSSLFFYNTREFTELILVQPVGRRVVYVSKIVGISLPLAFASSVGIGLPLLLFGASKVHTLLMVLSSFFLTVIFSSIALLFSVAYDDRVKGLAAGLGVWIYASVIYDAFILFVGMALYDYPIEKAVIILSLLNPVDLARILIVMNLDIAALMGYTGALFTRFVSSSVGYAIIISTLTLWILVPSLIGMFIFARRDF